MKRALLVLFAVVVSVLLVACGSGKSDSSDQGEVSGPYLPDQRAEAYAYTHGGYVGKAVVTVGADGSLNVDIDEAFLPHVLALVDIESADWSEANTVSYMSHGSESDVAKYVQYNDTVYVGVPTGNTFSYVEADENGNPIGDVDLEKAILRNYDTMRAYYALIAAGRFGVLPEFGGELIPVTTTSYGGLTKKNSPGYWNSGQTWSGNIKAIETFIEENGGQYPLTEMVRATEENSDGLKLWSVADTVTGATNSDFKDYFDLVQNALGRLKTK
jgi:major membrane immunogen (membrane-anchored lipoprotein)